MEKNFPLVVTVPLALTACVLAYLAFFVFFSVDQEVAQRLCLIGAFACLLGYNRSSPFWVVGNLLFLGWNFVKLAALLSVK